MVVVKQMWDITNATCGIWTPLHASEGLCGELMCCLMSKGEGPKRLHPWSDFTVTSGQARPHSLLNSFGQPSLSAPFIGEKWLQGGESGPMP